MNRRDFLNISLPAAGGMLAIPGVMNAESLAEIGRQFSGKSNFDTYDLVINGAGLSGYFTAIHAVKQGRKVLLVEKRSSPGYELAAKGRHWLGASGFGEFSPELKALFLPEEEKQELHNKEGAGLEGSLFDDEVLLLAGSVKKELLRSLLMNKIDVLLMTDVCGILSARGRVLGLLLAGKHGLHTVKCRNFVDASDQVLFSRDLLKSNYQINKAGFVLEVWKAKNPKKKEVQVAEKFNLAGNRLRFHRGKHASHQLFIEYEFPVASQSLEEIEHQSRRIAAELGRNFSSIDPALSGAQITQFALESSLHLGDATLPAAMLKGHFLLDSASSGLSCKNVLEIKARAQALVDDLRYSRKNPEAEVLHIIGSDIPVSRLSLTALDEPGLSVPLQNCHFDYVSLIKNREQCQVLVGGGGTAGGMAAIGAAEKGANTIVTDYFNDLGGTKTMCGVMGYYHGVRDQVFFKKQDADANQLAAETNMNKKLGRMQFLLNGVLDRGGRFLPGALMCGALTSGKEVKGILVCRSGKLEVLEGDVSIDATGDGDVAAFAGASYQIGNARTGKTQNYSQWDVGGAGKAPSATNRDYDIIDNTKISELQRGLFLSHYEAHYYDFYPMLAVRESRRIDGVYELNILDVVESTHFSDVLCRASSDFDPHYVGGTALTRCGFLLPHSNDSVVEVPYRSIVPKELDGLLISGRGFSQTHNALQFTRMTADLIVLGYLTGQIAADIAWKGQKPREYDVTSLQHEWDALGYFPKGLLGKKPGNLLNEETEISRRVEQLSHGKKEYLYECIKLPREKVLPVLKDTFTKTKEEENRVLLAKALAWFGDWQGNDLVEAELMELFKQEQEQGYPDDFVDNYDMIRGREKNVLEGLYWRINQNIGLLAMAGKTGANKTIQFILEHSTSGGPMMERENAYYNGRIDLKLVPFANRILNLCFYAERVPDPRFIPGFEKLLKDEYVGGYQTKEYQMTRWRVYGGDMELFIGATLARCGGKTGYLLLASYLEDIHYNFKDFSASELRRLTGADYGYDVGAWNKYVNKLSYPCEAKRLEETRIET